MRLKNKIVKLILLSLVICTAVGLPVNADEGETYGINVGVSPMNESIILSPGDVYRGSFGVNNPGYGEEDITYHTEVGPFYVDENYNPVYENVDGNSEMADWIKVTKGATGTLKPNEVATVEFEIDVPEDAPAGGQYAEISVIVQVSSGEGTEGINIGESMAIGHVILAEVTGHSVSSGRIYDMGVDSFILGGNIRAYSTVENTGNVHGQAIYHMKVYPIFSDQVVYDNEGTEQKQYILPGRKYQNETIWYDTPMVGIYNVQYSVEFMGETSEVTRMVIVCPWWLLLLISMGLILMVLRIVMLVKMRKKRNVEMS